MQWVVGSYESPSFQGLRIKWLLSCLRRRHEVCGRALSSRNVIGGIAIEYMSSITKFEQVRQPLVGVKCVETLEVSRKARMACERRSVGMLPW